VRRASRTLAAALALGFLALHLPYLAPSLEDVDSINFALGLRDFDVAEHQPHPPGYPLFIGVAKLLNAATGSEARTLSLLGVVSGTLAAFVLVGLVDRLDPGCRRPAAGLLTALTVLTAPLMWITAARPLSDVAGLLVALLVQWQILRAESPRELAASALAAGIGAGVRSQVVWLTVPLLVVAAIWNSAVRRPSAALSAAAAYAVGVVLWAVPLLVASGGPRAYWNALAFQGGADLSGVTMLWTTPTPRQLIATLEYAFFAPWGWWPLAAVLLVLAALGAWHLWRSAPDVLGMLAAGYGPYLVFSMLFQETVTTRYALPLVVPIAVLAVRGAIDTLPRVGGPVLIGASAIAVAIAQPTLIAYARQDAPAFRLLADMRFAQRTEPNAPVLAVHRRMDFDLRRPLRWVESDAPVFADRLPAPARLEWLELVKYWNAGGTGPVWFVADPLRSDLALVHHDAPRASYRWPIRFHQLIGGVRPNEMDWYELRVPAWYLGEGWALTPEAAGVAAAAGHGPGTGGSRGWIRRTPSPATLMIGGRLLPGGSPTARIQIFVDGHEADRFETPAGFFLRTVDLPAGALNGVGDYAALIIRADSDRVALEQFDAQPLGALVYGFAEGWHEHEYDPSTGELWRWTSDRSALRIWNAARPLTLRLRGESEAGREVTLTVRANDQVIAAERVGPSFLLQVPVPAPSLDARESIITIETDRSFVPAERQWRSQDRRRLGLKIFECRLTTAS
jgi:hypothetical protein